MRKIKLFDCEHEKDLEVDVNRFLKGLNDDQVIDIQYQVAAFAEESSEDQLYCFSVMIHYEE
ncbi:sporulation protein Cse60 [Bacillus fonticola]|uniref:sporulation protein Cse60 n=1 Tax=Bacillus fonticola TaxID=2728853 RepID=UPI001475F3FB|nr:sporulation protein Cse60 [Bacillus fonticola]